MYFILWGVILLILWFTLLCLIHYVRAFLFIILVLARFSHQRLLVGFQWSLSDSKSPQVSKDFLSIQAGLSNVLVWMVSILPLISNSSCLFSNLLGPFQVHRVQLVLLSPLCPTVFSALWLFSLSFIFTLWIDETAKVHKMIVHFYFLVNWNLVLFSGQD